MKVCIKHASPRNNSRTKPFLSRLDVLAKEKKIEPLFSFASTSHVQSNPPTSSVYPSYPPKFRFSGPLIGSLKATNVPDRSCPLSPLLYVLYFPLSAFLSLTTDQPSSGLTDRLTNPHRSKTALASIGISPDRTLKALELKDGKVDRRGTGRRKRMQSQRREGKDRDRGEARKKQTPSPDRETVFLTAYTPTGKGGQEEDRNKQVDRAWEYETSAATTNHHHHHSCCCDC